MKTIKILLAVFLAVFLTAVTVYAQYGDPVPPADPFAPPPPGKGGGGSYRVPEPSTLALLGIGLAAGLGYRISKKKKG